MSVSRLPTLLRKKGEAVAPAVPAILTDPGADNLTTEGLDRLVTG